MGVLPVEVDQPAGQVGQLRRGDQAAVPVGARPPLARHDPGEDHLVVVHHEAALDGRLGRTRAHDRGVGSVAGEQTDRTHQHRLARPRLARERGHAGVEHQGEGLDHPEVVDGQLSQHGAPAPRRRGRGIEGGGQQAGIGWSGSGRDGAREVRRQRKRWSRGRGSTAPGGLRVAIVLRGVGRRPCERDPGCQGWRGCAASWSRPSSATTRFASSSPATAATGATSRRSGGGRARGASGWTCSSCWPGSSWWSRGSRAAGAPRRCERRSSTSRAGGPGASCRPTSRWSPSSSPWWCPSCSAPARGGPTSCGC